MRLGHEPGQVVEHDERLVAMRAVSTFLDHNRGDRAPRQLRDCLDLRGRAVLVVDALQDQHRAATRSDLGARYSRRGSPGSARRRSSPGTSRRRARDAWPGGAADSRSAPIAIADRGDAGDREVFDEDVRRLEHQRRDAVGPAAAASSAIEPPSLCPRSTARSMPAASSTRGSELAASPCMKSTPDRRRADRSGHGRGGCRRAPRGRCGRRAAAGKSRHVETLPSPSWSSTTGGSAGAGSAGATSAPRAARRRRREGIQRRARIRPHRMPRTWTYGAA